MGAIDSRLVQSLIIILKYRYCGDVGKRHVLKLIGAQSHYTIFDKSKRVSNIFP